jgi:hypothetical protein
MIHWLRDDEIGAILTSVEEADVTDARHVYGRFAQPTVPSTTS